MQFKHKPSYIAMGGMLVFIGLLGTASISLAQGDAWTFKADMPTARVFAGGCVIDGKIYVISGAPSTLSVTPAVEMYDPIADTWTRKANIPSARCYPATCTFDGKIYVFGGTSPSMWSTAKKNVYVYDPQTDSWTQKADMPYENAGCGIAVVDGIIYLIGGMLSESSPPIPTVMAYDPVTESWTQKADMPTARYTLSACVLDGKIYAIGGAEDWRVSSYKHVEVYDPSTDTWTRKSDMPTQRWSLGTCVVDGKIFAIGGSTVAAASTTANEVYNPATDTWITKSPMQRKRYGPVVASVGNKIYAIGGSVPGFLSTVEEYDPAYHTDIQTGNVSGTWSLSNSPYHINGEITIPDSQTLIIEPGVEVVFTGHYKFNVQGRLLAIGTVQDTITFTAQDTKTGWHGIRFINTPITNDTSKIIFCRLQYGKANTGDGLDRSGGAILISRFDKVLVSNCLFDSNVNNGDLYSTGGAAIFIEYASPVITNSTFTNNEGITGAIGCLYNSQAIISNNVFTNNKCRWGGGVGCGISSNNSPVISGNYISDNSAEDGGGVYLVWTTNALVINNVIIRNHATGEGGGINCEDAGSQQLIIANNTVAYNSAPIGGGIETDDNSDPIIINTIFYGNSASVGKQICVSMDISDPCFLNCDIEGGLSGFGGAGAGDNYTGLYMNNIDSDPLFMDETNNDFRLMDSSPCISSGADSVEVRGTWYYAPSLDVEGNPRPNPPGTSPDIGAFESKLGGPYIRYLSNVLDDSDGNNNGRADAGETAKLVVTLKNTSLLDATGVSATLTNDDPDVQIIHATANFGDLARDQSSSNQNAPFTFSVSPSSVTHLSTFYLNITVAEGGYVYIVSFKILIGTPAILLVDDDEGKTYEVHYTKAFEMKQIYSEAWDVSLAGSPTIDVLQRYESVIWFTGDDRDSTLTAEEQSIIAAFLDGGGKLLITGQDIGYDLVKDGSASDSAFYTNYLHAQYVSDSSNTDKTRGLSGDPITDSPSRMSVNLTGSYGGAGNQTAPDVISPIPPAETILEYYRVHTGAALRYEDEATGSRLVYLAFGFEGIAGPSEDSAAKLMENILTWLGGLTLVEENLMESVVPKAYTLSQNYPNPFNPQTRIKYELPHAGKVVLKVYNILSQEICTLVDEVKPAGLFEAVWDGRDNTGHWVASGVYLYQLEVQDSSTGSPEGSGQGFVQTRKMLLLQ
jgi:N-acetylneuraminic acid mutarotase